MKRTVTREEQVPFLNPDGTSMQMVQHRIGVTVDYDEGEDGESELEELFGRERQKVIDRVPILSAKEKRIKFVLEALKKYTAPQVYESIVQAAKLIK